ncbi:MAG: hypothetical protein HRU41_07680 [Saprospiraceae bacterium]|nr:hypothetical protein [Saprospiraceae bacterium]
MRSLLPLFMLLTLLGCNNSDLQELSYEEYQTLIMTGAVPELDQITIRDEQGAQINVDSFMKLQKRGDYFDRFFKNEEGEIVAYQLDPKPPLRDLPIECEEVTALLDSIYVLDQARMEKYDPRQDYSNLEIVVNVLDKCGMPQNPSAAKSVFMVVQHNHNLYQKRYIDTFRSAAAGGLLAKSSLAMMEDRILSNEDQPQLYGTQVRRANGEEQWQLYQLADPERVDQRRAKMGLGPLKEYLQNFSVAFEVEQIPVDQ